MDNGAIPRAAPAANAAPVRSDLVPARPVATTEIAPQKVVQPVGETPAVHLEPATLGSHIASMLAAVDRQVDIEEGTRNVVVSWIDKDSGDVVAQFPTEQMLKLRAYWREQARAAEEKARETEKGAIIA